MEDIHRMLMRCFPEININKIAEDRVIEARNRIPWRQASDPQILTQLEFLRSDVKRNAIRQYAAQIMAECRKMGWNVSEYNAERFVTHRSTDLAREINSQRRN